MKFERVDVTGFGRLRDVTAEFGPRLTLITGPNESGKSTLLRAIRAALYGLDAGGPGRPVERSDWYRWQPWSPGAYGLALTYGLDDGRKIRVATRWDKRPPSAQVREVGGGDITSDMRHGRMVAPGLVHLGVDEAVFAATAWLGDDSLRLESADTPTQRSEQLREAIERLSDSGGGVTARDALARIEEAKQRIGTERKVTSALGAALQRLRQLETQITDARRRNGVIITEQERLRELESRAERASAREASCEIGWLEGKIGSLDAQLAEIVTLTARADELRTDIDPTAASFPMHDEDRIMGLAAELHAATVAEDRALAAWEGVADEVNAVGRRREEIDRGLAILGSAHDLDPDLARQAADLRGHIRAEQAARQRSTDDADDSRLQALRREIGVTGLGSIPVGSVDMVRSLADVARTRGRNWWGVMVLAALAVTAGLASVISTRSAAVGLTSIALGAAAMILGVSLTHRLTARSSAALRDLELLAPELDVSPTALHRMAERLPRVAALHAELQRQESGAAHRMSEVAAIDRRLAALNRDARELAASAGVIVNSHIDDDPATAALRAIDDAVAAIERRGELHREDAELATRDVDLNRLHKAADVAGAEREKVEATLRKQLVRASIPDSIPVTLAVAAFRDGCTRRRRHELASTEVTAIEHRLRRLGSPDSLHARRADYARELTVRGGDPTVSGSALDGAELASLDREVDHARREGAAATAQARELRGRLAALIENAPPLADLEDEKARCTAARDRAVTQRAALDLAAAVIEQTTGAVHRTLAPKLARSVGDRLSRLTDGRYNIVEIDPAHFDVALLGDERPEYVPLPLVSHGTRDQVSLLLRLSLAELLGTGERFPILLDEPLLSADEERRERALRALVELSRDQQVIVTVTDPTLVAKLEDSGADVAVVELSLSPDAISVAGVAPPALRIAR